MPMCETCGSVATRDEIKLDTEMDRTTCGSCRQRGPVQSTRFRVGTVFTEDGIEVTAITPNAELTYKDRWSDIVARIATWRTRRAIASESSHPKLVAKEA
jgi:hypothetical protein